MTAFLLRRFINYVALLFLATFFVFLLASATYDPLTALLGRNPPVPESTLAAKSAALHLGENPVLRYFSWLGGIFRGDFGETITAGSVNAELWTRIGVSVRLVTIGLVVGAVVGVLIGAYSAVRQYKLFDHVATTITFVLLSMPILVLAPIAKWLAVQFNDATGTRAFLYTGETTAGISGGFGAMLLDRAQHLILPTLVLILFELGTYARFMRSSMLDELNADYIRTARAKGLTKGRAVFRHGFRTAVIPLVALFAFSISGAFVGATFTERTFGWYGMGDWLVFGITTQDINVTLAVAFFTAVAVLVGGFLTDVITAALDPRVRS